MKHMDQSAGHEKELAVLLIEDDLVDQMAFIRHMREQSESYQIEVAGSIAEARTLLEKKTIDIIISDFYLGDGTPLDILPEIIGRGIPIIVVTSVEDHDAATYAIKIGVDDVLVKDQNYNYLKALPLIIERTLRKRHVQNPDHPCQSESGPELRVPEPGIPDNVKKIHERRFIIDQSELIARYRPDGAILFVNDVFCRFFKKTRGELIGKPFDLLLRPEERHLLESYRAALTCENSMVTLEHRILLPDGCLHWIRRTDRALFNEDGGIIEYQTAATDITDRKQAEYALQESEEKYRTLFNSANDMITLQAIDNDGLPGRYIDVNDVACRRLDYTRKELLSLSPDEIVAPECRESMQKNAGLLLSKGHATFQMTHITREGSRIPVEISAHLIEFRGQRMLLAIVRDITERMHSQAALVESEMRYRMIGDLIPFGLWTCDAKGNFSYLSESFLSALGITLEECRKTGWMHLLPREDYDRTIADWHQCIQTGSFWDYEYRIVDRNGKIFIVLSRGAPHMDSAGKITSWAGLHLDITERKRYEARLETSLREKEVAIKEVHHRVKNNMQVISSFLELQSNYIEDPVAIEKLNECQQRVRAMALVHEKLYQSKSFGAINAAEYIKSLIADLMISYSLSTLVDVSVDVDDVNINIDMAIPCGLIINELVTNSLKYAFDGRPEGKLSLTLHHQEDHMFSLVVQDDGIGLPPDYEARSAASLGMQLVNVLVRQLGGEVKTESDQGARFTIIFPEKF
jgi:PAS domain S-box-containing protein